MTIVSYLSEIIIPFVIVFVIGYGIVEKKNVYDIFIKGAKNGVKIVIKLFPTLLAIFLAINMLRNSGVIDFIINFVKPILNILNIPVEIMPLALLRPISGTASMAVATDIIKASGVDSKIGLIAATIMGATETTFYTIALYTSSIKVKKIRFALVASLIADVVGMATAIIIFNYM
mgnify:FL=1